MKIYTRTGDTGTTSLVGGKRTSKCDARIEAYGTVDELTAHIGYLHDMLPSEERKAELRWILDRLMSCGALLACEPEMTDRMPAVTTEDTARLEQMTDTLLEELPELRHFTLPCGAPALSYTHICRTVCRRAERRAIAAAAEHTVATEVLAFLNRLSDCLYAFGRRVGYEAGAEDIRWEPKK